MHQAIDVNVKLDEFMRVWNHWRQFLKIIWSALMLIFATSKSFLGTTQRHMDNVNESFEIIGSARLPGNSQKYTNRHPKGI